MIMIKTHHGMNDHDILQGSNITYKEGLGSQSVKRFFETK